MRDLYQAFAEARKLNKERGFTLIELLVVIAIIAILAAIAIPQFAKYRMRSFNAAADSDIRNLATAQEALYTDNFLYGATPATTSDINSANIACGTTGNELKGPLPAATASTSGALIGGARDTDGDGNPDTYYNIGIGISGNVYLTSGTDNTCQSYTAVSRHQGGDTAYGKDSDNTAIYKCQNDSWPGLLNIQATVPAPTANSDDFNGQSCGGSPVANWQAL